MRFAKSCHACYGIFSILQRKNALKSHIALSVVLFSFQVTAEEALSFSGQIELGYGYDSNVSVDDVDLNTSIGDRFADIQLSAETSYKAQNNLEFAANLTISEKMYDSFNEFDGLLTLASLSANKEIGNLEFGFSAVHIDYKLDRAGFLKITQLSPTVGWFYQKQIYLQLAYGRSDESYKQESDRDNSRDEIRASFYYFLNGLREYFSIQVGISKEAADAKVFNNEVRQIEVSYFNRINILSRDSTLKLAYLHQERDYKKSINSMIGDFREDRRRRYEIALITPIKAPWSLTSKIIYNDYESNLTLSDYIQKIYQITLKYDF